MSGEEQLGTCVLVLTTDQAPLDRGLASSKTKVEKTGAGMQASMDKAGAGMASSMSRHLDSMSRRTSQVGSTMTRNLTLPILATGAAAVKLGADFDAAMERVHTQSGATQQEVDALRGKVLELAKTSTQGPVALADALYRIEGAGFRGAKAMDALTAAAQLAAVGNANVEDTAKTLTQVMKPGIKGIKDFHDAVAQVNATVGAGDLRLQSLVDALGTGVVTSAKMVGLSFKDVTAAMAVFGDETNNVSGWAAQLATAFHFISNPGQKATGALEDIGLKQDSLAKDLHKPNGLLTALTDLKSHLDTLPGGIHGVKAGQVLGDIFPGGRGRVLTVLLNQTTLLEQKMHQIAGTTGQFAGSVAKTQETEAFKIHNAWAKIQADAVELGHTLGPTVVPIFAGIADEADKIATAFEKLPDGTQKAIITGGLITAGIGPALKVLSIFTGGIGKLITAEQFAQKLITGKTSLFGGTTPGQTSATAQIASLEVGEMMVRNLVGAGGARVGASPVAAREAKIAASEATTAAEKEAAVVGRATEQVALFGAQVEELGGQLQMFAFREEEAAALSAKAMAAQGSVIRGMVGGPLAKSPAGVGSSGVDAAPRGIGSVVKGAASRLVGGAALGLTGVAISQIVGTEVKGAVGSAIKHIGTDASVGAGLGSIFGPAGMAGGAIIGGLVGSFHQFIQKDAGKQGEDFARKFTAPLPDAVRKATTAAVAKAANSVSGAQFQRRLDLNTPGFTPGTKSARGQAAAQQDLAKIRKQFFNLGWTAGNATAQGLKSVKDSSANILISDFEMQLRKLPERARPEAAKVMLSFATGLNEKGKLPMVALEKIVKGMERQVPGLATYLQSEGMVTAQQFSKTLRFTQATDTLKKTLAGYRTQFADWSIDTKITGDNIDKNIAKAMSNLRQTVASSSGQTRKDAVAELRKLHDQTVAMFDSMGSKVQASVKSMSTAIKDGSASAAKVAGINLASFSSNVQAAMSSGVLSTGQGMQLIITNLNKALKEMGQKQLSPIQVSSLKLGVGKTRQLQARGAARGTMIQFGRHGQRGQDSIPVNFGEQHVMVAPGEQGLVLTDQQQAFLNRRTSDVGGLAGMFRKLNRRHGMATGGFVADPGTNFSVGQEPQITSLLGKLGRALGDTIYGISGYRSPAHSVAVGGFGDDPHTRGEAADIGVNSQMRESAAQIATATLRRFGLDRPFDESDDPSNSEVNHIQLLAGAAGAVGAAIAGAASGSAASIPTLTSPKVAGSGVMATLVKAALGKGTAGTNAYLGKFAGSMASLGTAGVAPGSWLKVAGELAKRFGWGGGQVQAWEGVENIEDSSYSLTATNPGSGAYGLAQGITGPGWYAAHGGNANTVVGQLTAMANYIHQRYGNPEAALAHEHAAGWYAQGGMIPGFAKGGTPGRKLSTAMQGFIARNRRHGHKPRHKARKGKSLGGWGAPNQRRLTALQSAFIGKGGPFPFDVADLASGGGIDQTLARIFGLDGGDSNGIGAGQGGDAAKMWNLIDWNTNTNWVSGLYPAPNFGSIASPGDFVISQDAFGNPVTPYVSSNLDGVVKQLSQAIGWQAQGVGDLHGTLGLSRSLVPAVRQAIARRVKVIAQIRRRIEANLRKIAALRAKVNAAKRAITAENKKKSPKGKAAAAAFQKSKSARLKSLSAQIKGYESQIKPIEAENRQLAGNPDSIGTGGELGTISTQLGDPGAAGAIATAEGGSSGSGLYGLLSTVQGWVGQLGGTGGQIAQQDLTLREWQANAAALGPGAASALTAAQAAAAASAQPTTPDNSALVALLQQQLAQSALTNAVSQAQYGVLSEAIGSLPRFGGSFATGGVVPGVMGEPRMILAHGKEEVLTADESQARHADDRFAHVILTKGPGVDQLIDARIETKQRGDVQKARRRLPGRAGVIR